MRHLAGFVLAVATSVALYFCAGWGVSRFGALAAHGGPVMTGHGLLALAAVVGPGLLIGVLVAVPALSPLASGLPGLALLGWSALLVVRSHLALRLIPMHGYYFTTGVQALLVSGVLALLGTLMIVPLFLPSRWRRREAGPDADIDVPAALGLTREPGPASPAAGPGSTVIAPGRPRGGRDSNGLPWPDRRGSPSQGQRARRAGPDQVSEW